MGITLSITSMVESLLYLSTPARDMMWMVSVQKQTLSSNTTAISGMETQSDFEPESVNQIRNLTFGELYDQTLAKEAFIKSKGYSLVTMWEADRNAIIKKIVYIQKRWRHISKVRWLNRIGSPKHK